MNPRLLLSLTALFLILGCSRHETESAGIVARAGEREITINSFKRAYLPVIMYGDKFDSPETRNETLGYLIGQKLLAQKGEESGFDTLSQVQAAREAAERKALARQLYQTWIHAQLPALTEEELQAGFQRSRRDLLVRHLFAETHEEAQRYYDALAENRASFQTIAQDIYTDSTLVKSGGLLGWIAFGDLDEQLEDVAYNLPVGTPSYPVESQYGWHVLQVDDWQQSVFHTEEDFLRDRGLIARKIQERRENLLSKQVLNNFMADQEIDFNRAITQLVWPVVLEHLYPPDPEMTESKDWRGPEFGSMATDLQHLQNEPLVFVNGEAWSVAKVLRRLPELSRDHLFGNLYVATSYLIRDELLAREARSLGLADDPEVIDEVQDSQDFLLAQIYVAAVADTLTFTDQHLRDHYEKYKLSNYHAPDSLLIRQIVVPSEGEADQVMRQLRQGAEFNTLQPQVSIDPVLDPLWILPQTHNDLYQTATRVAVGALAGPVKTDAGWSVITVEERRRWPLEYDQVEKQITEAMQKQRFSSTRDILIRELRNQYPVETHPDEIAGLWETE